MPLRWYFFVIGPAVAVALLWLIGASLDPAPSVRSPLHASGQSKPAAGTTAKTTTGTGNATGAASSGSAGNRSVATAPAPAATPAPEATPAPPAASTPASATDAVGTILPDT